MTPHVTFLAELPVRAILDGELVALDADGKPDFPLICECRVTGERKTLSPAVHTQEGAVGVVPVVTRGPSILGG